MNEKQKQAIDKVLKENGFDVEGEVRYCRIVRGVFVDNFVISTVGKKHLITYCMCDNFQQELNCVDRHTEAKNTRKI